MQTYDCIRKYWTQGRLRYWPVHPGRAHLVLQLIRPNQCGNPGLIRPNFRPAIHAAAAAIGANTVSALLEYCMYKKEKKKGTLKTHL